MSRFYHAIYLSIIAALAIGLYTILAPQVHRVVIFPLISTDPTTDDLAAKLTAELIRFVESTENMKVYPITDLPDGIQSAENHHLWPRDIQASLIFEGTIGVLGDNVRTTMQLIDGSASEHVWAGTDIISRFSPDRMLTNTECQMLVFAAR